MAVFTVNGKTVTAEKNQKLLRFLRDELRLTSVKDGCSEGACGTCTVLIDGKPTKACVPQTDKLEGKTILTVEGLSDWEKEVYTWAFGEAGAVQCGFCIPGMVISAKALLDTNPDPSREEAAFAIRNNICRCTGYVKIIDGILLAAKCFREGKLPEAPADWKVGSRVHRVDVRKRSPAPASTLMTYIWTGCSTAAPSAASTPVHGCWPSIRRKPGPCPVWSAS